MVRILMSCNFSSYLKKNKTFPPYLKTIKWRLTKSITKGCRIVFHFLGINRENQTFWQPCPLAFFKATMALCNLVFHPPKHARKPAYLEWVSQRLCSLTRPRPRPLPRPLDHRIKTKTTIETCSDIFFFFFFFIALWMFIWHCAQCMMDLQPSLNTKWMIN